MKISTRWSVPIAVMLVVMCFVVAVRAQDPLPAPTPDPVTLNVFYGATNPASNAKSAVLVFVHGLNGTASDWWVNNDMYDLAYNAGYRTAFVSLSADNSRNNATIKANVIMLQAVLPGIAQHFQTKKMYLIGHSKGGVDIQAALLNPATATLARAVVTISSPNTGTELANWAFANRTIAGPLGLLTPAVASVRTDAMAVFRTLADPILRDSGIPFYTVAGNVFLDSTATSITGAILRSLTTNITNDTFNDGLVTVERSRLPGTYATNLGLLPANHFKTNAGSVSFYKIYTVVQGVEQTFREFEKIAADGFSEHGGDAHNSWAWSMKWFKGDLYVGTGRESLCASLLTSDVRTGTGIYPFAILSTLCPDYQTLISSFGAEIWRYTVETDQWLRVFKSEDTIPVTLDVNGVVTTGITARDIGFRGMEVHIESGGTEALYVGSVTSGSMFEPAPFQPNGYPPPRILRTTDGMNWDPLPQEAGTFLGEAGNLFLNPATKPRSFRSLASYNGKLFGTLADFVGVGVVIASEHPEDGGDAWYHAGPSTLVGLPVWSMKEFNGFLYATTGLTRDQDPNGTGYGVYKTDAIGPAPYVWTPVVTNGGYQSDPVFRSPNGLSMEVFKGQLYVGTNRPTELIRIGPDDDWELVVGEPRMTPDGFKMPISGLGNGFGSWFNGHFWRMGTWQDHLYVLTWDWSVGLQSSVFSVSLDKMFSTNYGFNIYRSSDGIQWTAVTHTGLGDVNNSGGRSIEPTPFGLFIGTARQGGGLQIFRTDGPAPDPVHLPAPKNLVAASEAEVGRLVDLTWDPSPGAVRYQVYRARVNPIDEIIPSFTGPAAFPLPYQVRALPTATSFSEPAPTVMQSIYFVRAEDADGNLSPPSNLVGGPSKAASPAALSATGGRR